MGAQCSWTLEEGLAQDAGSVDLNSIRSGRSPARMVAFPQRHELHDVRAYEVIIIQCSLYHVKGWHCALSVEGRSAE
jgi:hypothetical protein